MPGNQITDMQRVLDMENALIVKVNHLTPGKLKMDVRSDGPHTVRVTGQSSATFVVGTSPKYLIYANGTEHEILTGITALVTLVGTILTVTLTVARDHIQNIYI